jgi:hypothetical protein
MGLGTLPLMEQEAATATISRVKKDVIDPTLGRVRTPQ